MTPAEALGLGVASLILSIAGLYSLGGLLAVFALLPPARSAGSSPARAVSPRPRRRCRDGPR